MAVEFPSCPRCQDNRLVTGLPTSYVCSRCGCTFIPDVVVLKSEAKESKSEQDEDDELRRTYDEG